MISDGNDFQMFKEPTFNSFANGQVSADGSRTALGQLNVNRMVNNSNRQNGPLKTEPSRVEEPKREGIATLSYHLFPSQQFQVWHAEINESSSPVVNDSEQTVGVSSIPDENEQPPSVIHNSEQIRDVFSSSTESKELSSTVDDSDKICDVFSGFDNFPEFCPDYAYDIIRFLKTKEKDKEQYLPPNFLSTFNPLIAENRDRVAQGLSRVSHEVRSFPETMMTTVRMMDHVLSRVQVSSKKINLVGATCLWISSKLEEEHGIAMRDIVALSRCTENELKTMERHILTLLDFKVVFVTPYDFLRRFSFAAQNLQAPHNLSKCLVEISLFSSTLSSFTSSTIAAAAIYLARRICWVEQGLFIAGDSCCLPFPVLFVGNEHSLRHPNIVWDATLRHYTGFSIDDIAPAVRELNRVFAELPAASLYPVFEKYTPYPPLPRLSFRHP